MPTADAKESIIDYITAHPEINEVILSGGDPLNVTNRRLFAWLDTLESLPQLTTIRLHTRLPLVIPARLDNALFASLSQSRCHIVMVIHCNHANEIDALTAEHLQRAREAGITLLNQAVLLKGINDSVYCSNTIKSAFVCLWGTALLSACIRQSGWCRTFR